MNTVTLIGFLAVDPEIKESKSGNKYTALSIPLKDYSKKDEATTVWVRCSIIGKVFERLEKMINYLKKGSYIMVTGQITDNRAYISKDGDPKANIEINVSDIKFMPSRKEKELDTENLADKTIQNLNF